MADLIVYGVIAAIAIGPVVWPLVQARRAGRPDMNPPGKPSVTPTADATDWRQPWVGKLMDLQRVLEEKGNSVAADTTKKLVTEIIYDGKPTQ